MRTQPPPPFRLLLTHSPSPSISYSRRSPLAAANSTIHPNQNDQIVHSRLASPRSALFSPRHLATQTRNSNHSTRSSEENRTDCQVKIFSPPSVCIQSFLHSFLLISLARVRVDSGGARSEEQRRLFCEFFRRMQIAVERQFFRPSARSLPPSSHILDLLSVTQIFCLSPSKHFVRERDSRCASLQGWQWHECGARARGEGVKTAIDRRRRCLGRRRRCRGRCHRRRRRAAVEWRFIS